jgi:hypothetical protein
MSQFLPFPERHAAVGVHLLAIGIVDIVFPFHDKYEKSMISDLCRITHKINKTIPNSQKETPLLLLLK